MIEVTMKDDRGPPQRWRATCKGCCFRQPQVVSLQWSNQLSGWASGDRTRASHAVLVKLLSVAAKHIAFQASKRLRGLKIRLDEDLTPQQMKTRRGLSADFQGLKSRGYKPFFRGVTLIRKCARGEANKVVTAAAQAARATAPPPPRQQQAQEPHATVAMDPLALLHQHGISLDQLSDPSSVVAKAAQAIIADFDMMCASDDDVAS
ncbi:TPA: hypothetical protein ACH3X1_008073 [Trebouxia sp. C0004]